MKRLFLLLALLLSSQLAFADRLTLREYENLGGDFTLTDQNGKPYQLAKRGKIVMLFFGYLNCPDICPTTLVEMVGVKELLGSNVDKVEFVYVTLDPKRDSIKNIKDYLINFDEEFVGLRGDEKQIAAVAKQYNVLYRSRKLRSALGYSVDHSAAVYMIGKDTKLRYIFPSKSPTARYVQGLEMFLKGITPNTKVRKCDTWFEKMMK